MFSQSKIKKYFRYCLIREWFYGYNTSGLYARKLLPQCAIECGISFNTLRQVDIKQFEKEGLLCLYKEYVRFNALPSRYEKYWKIFKTYRNELLKQEKPSLYFAGLIKKRHIFYNVKLQSQKEAEKIADQRLKKSYLALVNKNNTPIGGNEGIYLSLGTIGRILGKSKSSAAKYVNQLVKLGLLKVKKNKRKVCRIKRWNAFLYEPLVNRVFAYKGWIYERLLNSYTF